MAPSTPSAGRAAATATAAALTGAALAIVGMWLAIPLGWRRTASVAAAAVTPAAAAAAGGPGAGEDEDGELQRAILDLWFGGGDVEHIYRHRWFCAPGSERQRTFDAEIYDTYAPLFRALCDDVARGGPRGRRWRSSAQGAVALIVLLDQLGRHIHRHDPACVPSQADADKVALSVAKEVEARGWLGPSSSDAGRYSTGLAVPEFVFTLMPWRHAPTVEGLQHVVAHIDAQAAHEEQLVHLLQKFRKTTVRRLEELQDRAKAAADDDVLEHLAFEAADEKEALPKHKVALAMRAYLDEHVAGRDIKAVAVSLSGGVDSMVIAALLRHFQPHYGYERVVALHIDYANRAESGKEADYLEYWCLDRGITFRKRVVGEVTRGVTARDEYERVARDIRFGFYREAMAEFDCPAVMLGHHVGDVQENVISNVMRGAGPLHLSGMGQVSVVNGVPIHRPLLHVAKDGIFDLAHRFGVPYFKDTTPTWSTRGKLRRRLLPLLADMYGDGFLRNLSHVAAESDELRELVAANIFQPFWDQVTHDHLALHVDCGPFRQQSAFFWREALRHLVHARGQGMLTDKGVDLLRRRLEESEGGEDGYTVWCQLRKDYATLLYGPGPRLFIFRPCVIRDWDQRGCAKEEERAFDALVAKATLPIDGPQPIRLGPWAIKATTIARSNGVSGSGQDEDGEERELDSLEAFCTGVFGYTLVLRPCKACGGCPSLRFRQEGGYKRLGSFQSIPLRVKRSIPIAAPVCPACEATTTQGAEDGLVTTSRGHREEDGRRATVPVDVRIHYRFMLIKVDV